MRAVVRAKRTAQRVLVNLGIQTLPVPVEKIAKQYALVAKMELQSGISGMLIPLEEKGQFAIVVNKSDNTVRQRFTIAHELGHLILHSYTTPHADHGFRLRYRDARSSDGSVLEEIEANQFAAELLMPESAVMKAIWDEELDYDPSLDDLEEDPKIARIAKKFQVSKQALLIRLSNLMA